MFIFRTSLLYRLETNPLTTGQFCVEQSHSGGQRTEQSIILVTWLCDPQVPLKMNTKCWSGLYFGCRLGITDINWSHSFISDQSECSIFNLLFDSIGIIFHCWGNNQLISMLGLSMDSRQIWKVSTTQNYGVVCWI